MTLEQLEELLRVPHPTNFPIRLIAIDGHGGAGKSTLAAHLAKIMQAEVLHTDDFSSVEDLENHWRRLSEEVIVPIIAGEKSLSYERFRWGAAHNPAPVIGQPVTKTMIIEGVGSSRRELRPYLSYVIWVETPKEVCIARGLERDGQDARLLWEKWWTQEEAYIKEHNPKDYANLILDGTDTFEFETNA